jgi:hypothetical protein
LAYLGSGGAFCRQSGKIVVPGIASSFFASKRPAGIVTGRPAALTAASLVLFERAKPIVTNTATDNNLHLLIPFAQNAGLVAEPSNSN